MILLSVVNVGSKSGTVLIDTNLGSAFHDQFRVQFSYASINGDAEC